MSSRRTPILPILQHFLQATLSLSLLAFLANSFVHAADAPPNIVMIVADDLGYADLGCFGAKQIRTPVLDRLARQGTRFTDFCVAQSVFTASRAALLSGCYPNRIGMAGALNHTSTTGINPDEVLLSELCKAHGYATACFLAMARTLAPQHPFAEAS